MNKLLGTTLMALLALATLFRFDQMTRQDISIDFIQADPYYNDFVTFQQTYNKQYKTEEEMKKRFQIYKENKQHIDLTNE